MSDDWTFVSTFSSGGFSASEGSGEVTGGGKVSGVGTDGDISGGDEPADAEAMAGKGDGEDVTGESTFAEASADKSAETTGSTDGGEGLAKLAEAELSLTWPISGEGTGGGISSFGGSGITGSADGVDC